MYSESLSTPSPLPFVSSFSQSSVYAVSPHEVSLLFQMYNAREGGTGDSQGVGLSEWCALFKDFLRALCGGLEEQGLRELSGAVNEWVGEEEGGVEGWAGRVFREMDNKSSGRVDKDEFAAFLPLMDAQIGERLRRRWKSRVTLPRLEAIARL